MILYIMEYKHVYRRLRVYLTRRTTSSFVDFGWTYSVLGYVLCLRNYLKYLFEPVYS